MKLSGIYYSAESNSVLTLCQACCFGTVPVTSLPVNVDMSSAVLSEGSDQDYHWHYFGKATCGPSTARELLLSWYNLSRNSASVEISSWFLELQVNAGLL